MKYIKKVAVSQIKPADGSVVDSFTANVDKTTNAPSIRAVEELLENYTPSGGASVLETNPIGAILEWPSNTIPTNWLLCNGQAVSRTDYSELFAVIGTTYGAGDGSTTFNVPDRRGNIAIGKNDSDTDFNTLGKTGGAKKRTLVLANIPSHSHTFTGTAHTHTLNGHTHSVGAHSHGLNSHTHSIPALSGTAASAGSHSHSVRSLANAANTGGNNYLREWSKSGDTATNGVGSAGAHTHSVTTTASTSGKASGSTANSSAFNTGANSGNTSSTTATGTVAATGSGTEFDIMNPHIVQNFIIKAKETAATVAKVEDSLTSDSTTDALSAAQGKKLKELIDNLPNSEIQGTGAPEIAIGPNEPTGEEVLWIDEEEIDEEDLDMTHLLEKTAGVVLYDNYIGSIEDITLSESAMNFEYIEVFGNRGNRSFSVRVRTNSTYFILNHMRFVNDMVYTYIKEVHIQDNILHPMYSKLVYGGSAFDDAATLITKVVGFNRYNSKVMKFYVMTDSSTYDNISFNFDNGMTWEEFTNSSYNTDNTFKINNSQVESTANSNYHLAYYTSGNNGGYNYVTYSSVIDPNKTYFWGSDK